MPSPFDRHEAAAGRRERSQNAELIEVSQRIRG